LKSRNTPPKQFLDATQCGTLPHEHADGLVASVASICALLLNLEEHAIEHPPITQILSPGSARLLNRSLKSPTKVSIVEIKLWSDASTEIEMPND